MMALENYLKPWTLKNKKYFPAHADQKTIHHFDLEFINPQFSMEELKKSRCILLVNTATGCGLHNQLEQLQQLYTLYKDLGFLVVAAPSPDFMNQEKREGQELQTYCEIKYGATYPFLKNMHVVSEPIHPLFQWLNRMQKPVWNFQKYLFNTQGFCIATAGPRANPFILEQDIQQILHLKDNSSISEAH